MSNKIAVTTDDLLERIRQASTMWLAALPGSAAQHAAMKQHVLVFTTLDRLLCTGEIPLPRAWAGAAEPYPADVIPLPGTAAEAAEVS
jgi:hypothetical protein